MKVLGITGNIAAGKSLAASMLAERGAHVIDADAVVHELYHRGTPVFEAVTARFGESVAGAEAIDRAPDAIWLARGGYGCIRTLQVALDLGLDLLVQLVLYLMIMI